jgi:uncharacterized protein (TIGR00299 family) protein
MKIAYFDCFSGISGDMTIGAFLDAGLNINTLSRELKKLKLKGYELKKRKVLRGGIAGTKFDCIIKDEGHNHRPVKEILNIIKKSALSGRVKSISTGIFKNIGHIEKKIHGLKSGDDVRLHELGSMDSIIDIVGAAIAVDELGIDEFHSSAVNTGRGFVRAAHGMLPVPAPATLELLKGVPLKISAIEAELVTPTGAGILKTLVREFSRMPQIEISVIGYGAGAKDFEKTPNMLRLLIGEAKDTFKEDRVCVIEANIDDMNPQYFEYLFERLFKEGALDVYITPIQMKKSRPAFKLTVMAKPSMLDKTASIIFGETTTIGLRFREESRFILERKVIKVKTRYGGVKVKISSDRGGAKIVSPEYEECARIARNKNIPLKIIMEEAKNAFKNL